MKAIINNIKNSVLLRAIGFLFLPLLVFVAFSYFFYPLAPHCSLGNGLLGCTPICKPTSYFPDGKPADYEVTPCFHEGPATLQRLLFQFSIPFYVVSFIFLLFIIFKVGFKTFLRKIVYITFAPIFLIRENRKNKNVISRILVILISFLLVIEWGIGYWVAVKSLLGRRIF